MKNWKCIKPHLSHGKNKSIKRIFIILYSFAKIPRKRIENKIKSKTFNYI